MERPGERLKRIREKLGLTYRDVERASQQIADHRRNDDFIIALSRLSDIENKGTIPSIFRMYSLCAVYRLAIDEVLSWYGVPSAEVVSEGLGIQHRATHAAAFGHQREVTVPLPLAAALDPTKTTFLSQTVRRWGKLPLSFLNGWQVREFRYGILGTEDWSMYPILHPGSLLAIDDTMRRIGGGKWSSEMDRPIHFLEHRLGYLCGWCSLHQNRVTVQFHPSSQKSVAIFDGSEIDVLGQVVGVAMWLDSRMRRTIRSGATPAESPNR
jgi:transcriptional regulator with XRE-family HTH domain